MLTADRFEISRVLLFCSAIFWDVGDWLNEAQVTVLWWKVH